jgi:hypothetical protein
MALCPKCSQQFRTPEDEVAESFSCPKCGYDPEKDLDLDRYRERIERCADCACLADVNDGCWWCDEYGEYCLDVDPCGEWETEERGTIEFWEVQK